MARAEAVLMVAWLAVAAVAAVGLWCLVVLPALWLCGTINQLDDNEECNDAEG